MEPTGGHCSHQMSRKILLLSNLWSQSRPYDSHFGGVGLGRLWASFPGSEASPPSSNRRAAAQGQLSNTS